MKKKILLLFVGVLLLAGCHVDYGKSDIEDYLEEKYGITDVSISDSYEEYITNEAGEKLVDKIWTVKDKKNNIEFHVIDNHSNGMEMSKNYLSDDFSGSLYIKNTKNKNIGNIKTKKRDEYGGKTNEIDLICDFNNKNELNKCYDEIKNIYDTYTKKYPNFNIFYQIIYTKEKNIHGRNNAGRVGYINMLYKDDVYNDLIYNYYSFGYSNRIDEIINEMTTEDINNLFNNKNTDILYKVDNNNSILKQYDDIIGVNNGNGLSVAGLYYLLKDEGYVVNGTKENFNVNDKNGNVLEFSYNFNDYVYGDAAESHLGYYYRKNGEKIPMKDYYCDYFESNVIKELFDINICIVPNYYKDKSIVDGKINTN